MSYGAGDIVRGKVDDLPTQLSTLADELLQESAHASNSFEAQEFERMSALVRALAAIAEIPRHLTDTHMGAARNAWANLWLIASTFGCQAGFDEQLSSDNPQKAYRDLYAAVMEFISKTALMRAYQQGGN